MRTRPRAVLCWLLAAAALGCGEAAPPLAPPRGIVLVVLDTLRADGLSTYGNPRPTSPALDALARRGVLFENAISHASWTLPSFIGLLSGRYPSRTVFSDGKLRASLLEPLRVAGFTTAAFTEGGYVSRQFGVDLGFDRFSEQEGATFLAVPGRASNGTGGIQQTFDAAIAWLREPRTQPFFLLVHTYEIHLPYRHRDYAGPAPAGLHPSYEERDRQAVRAGAVVVGEAERAYVRALYDGGVLAADREVARLLGALEELSLARDTVVVVTSDHGEDLGERDRRSLGEHGHHLYDELLRVPLIVYDPRGPWPARRIGTQVRLVDLMPTLLELAGAELPGELAGRSLLPVLRGSEREPRLAFSELRRSPWTQSPRAALRDGRYKLIANLAPRAPGAAEFELYDVVRDPGERDDLVGLAPPALARLGAELEAERASLKREGGLSVPSHRELSPELRERLEALGYVEDEP